MKLLQTKKIYNSLHCCTSTSVKGITPNSKIDICILQLANANIKSNEKDNNKGFKCNLQCDEPILSLLAQWIQNNVYTVPTCFLMALSE